MKIIKSDGGEFLTSLANMRYSNFWKRVMRYST
jgi:hypothetical protein